MNFVAGLSFICFLSFFGFVNYLIMLRRYDQDLKKRKILQRSKISNLYPKGTFIHI